MNKSVFIKLFNLKSHFCDFFHATFKSKHSHYFMAPITALFNQKHSLIVNCVDFYFWFN